MQILVRIPFRSRVIRLLLSHRFFHMQILIQDSLAGVPVKDYLRRELHLSAHMIKRLKYSDSGITVDGRRVTTRHILRAGETLVLATDDSFDDAADAPAPADLPLAIVYEDEDIVVPSKPADMPTHPSHNHTEDTVANALAYRYAQAGMPFIFRPINRLDRNTSGLLIVARNQIAAQALNQSMRKKAIRKTYLAVLSGCPEPREGSVSACLCRTEESIIVRQVCDPDHPGAQPALTEYKTLAVSPSGFSLVAARPVTGRTHQLRVHFAHIGHPIVGDDLYGTASPDIGRQALHAWQIEFQRPSDGKELTLRADPPDDFMSLVHNYFPDYTIGQN